MFLFYVFFRIMTQRPSFHLWGHDIVLVHFGASGAGLNVTYVSFNLSANFSDAAAAGQAGKVTTSLRSFILPSYV